MDRSPARPLIGYRTAATRSLNRRGPQPTLPPAAPEPAHVGRNWHVEIGAAVLLREGSRAAQPPPEPLSRSKHCTRNGDSCALEEHASQPQPPPAFVRHGHVPAG